MKKLLLVPLLLLFVGQFLISEEFYICLGSFVKQENAVILSDKLDKGGISTVYEEVIVNDTVFTRVLYSYTFKSYKRAKTKLTLLTNNAVIKALKIQDLWVRPGLLIKASLPSAPETHDEFLDESASFDDGGFTTSEDNPNKVIHSEGYANIIFSVQPIELGMEDQYYLKTEFTSDEHVYGRAYFPEAVGYVTTEDFWHEIWIDGKLKKRTFFNEEIDENWDQIQLYITEEDYTQEMANLSPGEHTIIIWVMKNEYKGNEVIAEPNESGEIESKVKEIWVPKRLSKGKFTYIVE